MDSTPYDYWRCLGLDITMRKESCTQRIQCLRYMNRDDYSPATPFSINMCRTQGRESFMKQKEP